MLENLTQEQITISFLFILLMAFIILFIHEIIVVSEFKKIIKEKNVWIDMASQKLNDNESELEKFRLFNDDLLSNRDDLLERINKLQSQVKHKKYIPLEKVKSDKWKCLTDIIPYFIAGDIYTEDKTCQLIDGSIWLYADKDDSHPYLVSKKLFKNV